MSCAAALTVIRGKATRNVSPLVTRRPPRSATGSSLATVPPVIHLKAPRAARTVPQPGSAAQEERASRNPSRGPRTLRAKPAGAPKPRLSAPGGRSVGRRPPAGAHWPMCAIGERRRRMTAGDVCSRRRAHSNANPPRRPTNRLCTRRASSASTKNYYRAGAEARSSSEPSENLL